MLNLTIEEATVLEHELSYLTVSYYNAELRNALSKIVNHCREMIEEHEEIQLDSVSEEIKQPGK